MGPRVDAQGRVESELSIMLYQGMSETCICKECKHYKGGDWCEAFPEGIPPDILSGEVQHIEWVPYDGGIQFEARD